MESYLRYIIFFLSLYLVGVVIYYILYLRQMIKGLNGKSIHIKLFDFRIVFWVATGVVLLSIATLIGVNELKPDPYPVKVYMSNQYDSFDPLYLQKELVHDLNPDDSKIYMNPEEMQYMNISADGMEILNLVLHFEVIKDDEVVKFEAEYDSIQQTLEIQKDHQDDTLNSTDLENQPTFYQFLMNLRKLPMHQLLTELNPDSQDSLTIQFYVPMTPDIWFDHFDENERLFVLNPLQELTEMDTEGKSYLFPKDTSDLFIVEYIKNNESIKIDYIIRY